MTYAEKMMGLEHFRRYQNLAAAGRKQSKADAAQHWGNVRRQVEAGGLVALTVQQPYAYLLLLPDGDERAKRVENRCWRPQPWLIGKRIVIHAGVSKARLSRGDDLKWPLVFGAGLGTVRVVGALAKRETGSPATGWENDEFPKGYEWLATHRHSVGPVCWVVADPVRFDRPIPCAGAQGLWIFGGVV